MSRLRGQLLRRDNRLPETKLCRKSPESQEGRRKIELPKQERRGMRRKLFAFWRLYLNDFEKVLECC